jgi:hypothetical protein
MKTVVSRRRLRRGLVLLTALASLAAPIPSTAGAQVPFEAADVGGWGQGSHDCGALFPVRVDGAGTTTATHLGRFTYVSRECVDFGAYPFPYGGRFTMTAANGDTIVGTYVGTATIAADGVTILYHQTATVTGGTGRFAGATGELDVNGIAFADGSYVQHLAGAISSVGGSQQ